MTFPFRETSLEVEPEDLARFRLHFAKTITDFLPCGTIHFLPLSTPEFSGEMTDKSITCIANVKHSKQPFIDSEENNPSLFMPVWNGEELIGVSVLEGGDPSLYEVPIDWLLEQSHLISREFYLLKQAYIDPVTGLLNSKCLREELKFAVAEMNRELSDTAQDGISSFDDIMVLLEIYPRARNAERGLSYIAKAASYLSTLLGHSSPLYHFGSGVFCQIWSGVDIDNARKMGGALLKKLKQEDFVCAHLGLASLKPNGGQEKIVPELFFEQSWQALETARKRGSFALCAHASEKDMERHPFRPLSAVAQSWFRKLWRGKDSFAVVLIQQDHEAASNHFTKRVTSLLEGKQSFLMLNQREAYVYLDGFDEAQAFEWVKGFKKKMKSLGGATFSAGIAVYPCLDFKKSDTPINARKALIHTSFYGPDTGAAFDAVSLNISGDVYYNEGDLRKALKEYRKGLVMDPESLNLHNSMGVTYAQMSRPKMAILFFEKALLIDRKDFMALYNLGFAFLTLKKIDEAVGYFERALVADDKHFDLLFQLGKLYCKHGHHKKAVRLLSKCVDNETTDDRSDMDLGAAYRYLGESCLALNKNQEAIGHFQRAVSFNPRYPSALSFLGELYAAEGQGDDIALSLCSQAVALDDTKYDYWHRLGSVQWQLGEDTQAISSLKQSLQCNRKSASTAFLLGEVYKKQGQARQAKKMYERVLRLDPGHKKAQRAVKAISAQ